MNEGMANDAYKDLIIEFKRMQASLDDRDQHHRAKIIKIARTLCRATATGFWVEVGKMQGDGFCDMQWEPLEWLPTREHALRYMQDCIAHEKNNAVYRVVDEDKTMRSCTQ